MRKFFNLENPVWSFFSKIFCMVYLNLLWLVCCLPVVTIGPSTTALYYAMFKVLSGDDSELTRHFFHSFRQNLKQGMVLGMIATAAGVVCVIDYIYYIVAPGKIDSVMQVFQIIIVLLYLMILTWLFGVLAKFENTSLNILQFSFFLSFKHFGYTLMMLVMEISIFLIEFFYVPLLALFGMGLISFVKCICFRAVFQKYVPEPPEEILDDAEDSEDCETDTKDTATF